MSFKIIADRVSGGGWVQERLGVYEIHLEGVRPSLEGQQNLTIELSEEQAHALVEQISAHVKYTQPK